MSGAVAAHAAYNGSGTQGLAVTNKIHDDDGDVMSVFWNKNDTTRQLLYGSSIIEIPASGSGGSLKAGGNQIFTVNNDIDGIGDLYLQITTDGLNSGTVVDSFELLACIKRIEFMVGTQVWQTLETDDIGALNTTEMSEESFESFAMAMTGGFLKTGARQTIEVGTSSNPAFNTPAGQGDRTGVLRIPALSRSVGPKLAKYTDISEHAYLLAAAPHQAVKIKVYMATTSPLAVTGFHLKLFGQCIVMCNEEREQMKAMPMGLPKRLKMTQNSHSNLSFSAPVGTSSGTRYSFSHVIDLDHFSLYTSHLVVVCNATDASGVTINSSIDTLELKLNSSSFSGELEGGLLTGPAADALGLYSNGIYTSGANRTDNYYVFPLASKAYGGSSVPLNRFDNVRLSAKFTVTLGGNLAGNLSVTVTCVGETTALYKGGAASLAMY